MENVSRLHQMSSGGKITSSWGLLVYKQETDISKCNKGHRYNDRKICKCKWKQREQEKSENALRRKNNQEFDHGSSFELRMLALSIAKWSQAGVRGIMWGDLFLEPQMRPFPVLPTFPWIKRDSFQISLSICFRPGWNYCNATPSPSLESSKLIGPCLGRSFLACVIWLPTWLSRRKVWDSTLRPSSASARHQHGSEVLVCRVEVSRQEK